MINASGVNVSRERISSNDEFAFKTTKLIHELGVVRQSVGKLIDASKSSAPPSLQPDPVLEKINSMFDKMSDNLLLVRTNKEQVAKSSYRDKELFTQTFDHLAEEIEADCKELEASRNAYIASFAPDPAVAELPDEIKKSGKHQEPNTLHFSWRTNRYDGTPKLK